MKYNLILIFLLSFSNIFAKTLTTLSTSIENKKMRVERVRLSKDTYNRPAYIIDYLTKTIKNTKESQRNYNIIHKSPNSKNKFTGKNDKELFDLLSKKK